MTVQEQRQQKAQDLTEELDRLSNQAKAFRALAVHIRETPVPVQSFRDVWESVAQRLEGDAVFVRDEAIKVKSHLGTVRAAMEAAS